jgi:glycerate kinase
MNVLIAADKFKGSLSAVAVCRAIAEGVIEADPSANVTQVPMADGGEGTSEILTALSKGTTSIVRVHDPLGRPVEATFGLSPNRAEAFIEMAEASGLTRLSIPERNPAHTSTVGTGELILAAIDAGAKRIIMGIGGSATNDVGIGMASALGFRFLDEERQELIPVGINLGKIHFIDSSHVDKRIDDISFIVLCDVTNPLYGPDGASCVFAAQKGAERQTVEDLEKGVVHFSNLVREKYGVEINFPGAGAAGGLGAGAKLFLGASLRSGIGFMIDYTSLEKSVMEADLVITGEGKADQQTLSGKVVAGIGGLCRASGKPLWLVTGNNSLSADELVQLGIHRAIGLVNLGIPSGEAMRNSFQLVKDEVRKAMQLIGGPARG